MRTFIAVSLDKEIKESVLSFINKLKKETQNVRWAKQEGIHLTLKFLGDISQDQSLKVQSILKETSEKHNIFSLSFKGIGTFPKGEKRARVIWIGIEDNGPLLNLQSDLEERLAKLNFPKEERKFHPHLTLGRVKNNLSIGNAFSLLENHKNTVFGDMSVNKISLFRSTLKPSGAEYNIISEFPLR